MRRARRSAPTCALDPAHPSAVFQAGEPFGVLVASPTLIDGLVAHGTIRPETRIDLVRSGIGVEVRADAPKPDISSVGAFEHALLGARSIAFLKEGGQSGVYLAGPPRATRNRGRHPVEGRPAGN